MGNDTIAAIATPEGLGGISIIRISGNTALSCAAQVFVPRHRPLNESDPWRMHSGHIKHPVSGVVLDEVLAVYFKNPNSFTGEDTVEISCHGNPLIARSVLEAIISSGPRLAEPGEFTRRAFENGRIDLSQAEAVAMMTASESEAARRAALRMLQGGLSDPLRQIRQSITHLRIAFELDLDFPEENASVSQETVSKSFRDAIRLLSNLIDAGDAGDQLRQCPSIVISGKVNAGKSSLFNQLTGRNRAIVSDEAGTTRDILEVSSDWNGCHLTLVDTAGIRHSPSVAETEAVRRSNAALEQSDLVIYVVDGSNPDLELLETVIKIPSHGSIFVFWNKTDLSPPDLGDIERLHDHELIAGFFQGSARNGIGVRELREGIVSHIDTHLNQFPDTFLMMTIRQRQAIEKSMEEIREAIDLHQSGTGYECVIPLLQSVDSHLGSILGDTVSPDILGQIFSRFCIGK